MELKTMMNGLNRCLLGLLMSTAIASAAAAQLDADFSASVNQGMLPLQVSFSDTTTGGVPIAWNWFFGDGGTSQAQNPTHTYTTIGDYTVTVIVVASGFQVDTETKVDFIDAQSSPLLASFTASVTSGTNPLTVNFSDTSTGGQAISWLWDFGDGKSSNVQHPTHIYTLPGTHDVTLVVGIVGQSDSVTQSDLITVAPTPLSPDFNASVVLGRAPLDVTFSDMSTGGPITSWAWFFGDGSFSGGPPSAEHSYTASTLETFDVTLTISSGQQQASITKSALITVVPGSSVSPVTLASQNGFTATSLALGDLDGDGDLDLASTWSSSNQTSKVVWHDNTNGVGTFAFLAYNINTTPVDADSVSTSDLDGDGDLDVLYSDPQGGQILWNENTNGTVSFGPNRIVEASAGVPLSPRAGDLDDDGDLDVLYTISLADQIVWRANDGLGNFGPRQVITTAVDKPVVVDFADLNGDGSLDLLSASGRDGFAWFASTPGAGSFGALQPVDTVNTIRGRAVGSADIDGDGDLDMLGFSTSSAFDEYGLLVWFENLDGLGSFGPQQGVDPSYPFSTLAYTAVDYDEDGDVDLVSSRSLVFQRVGWHENLDGLGSFAPFQTLSMPAYAFQLVALDLDLDQDVDILSAAAALQLHPNLKGSPGWPFLGDGLAGSSGTPLLRGHGELSPGGTVILEMSAALAGSVTTLIMGLTALEAPFKGGILVPNPDVVLAGLPVDSAGDSFLVGVWPPGVPAGLPIWFQQWVSDPLGPAGFSASNATQGTTAP